MYRIGRISPAAGIIGFWLAIEAVKHGVQWFRWQAFGRTLPR